VPCFGKTRPLAAALILVLPSLLAAQAPAPPESYVPPLATLMSRPASELHDGGTVCRTAGTSPGGNDHLFAGTVGGFRAFSRWRARIGGLRPASQTQVDYLLLRDHIGSDLASLRQQASRLRKWTACFLRGRHHDLHERSAAETVTPEARGRAAIATRPPAPAGADR
jgi:hypothetical protein